jgi:hypothetical protein
MKELFKAPHLRQLWLPIHEFLSALFLVLLAFAVPPTLAAQEKASVTLIPGAQSQEPLKIDRTSTISLQFQGVSLPPNATVTAAKLSLFSTKAVTAKLNITVKVRMNWKSPVDNYEEFGVTNLPPEFEGRAFVPAREGSPFLKDISTTPGGGAGSGKMFMLELASTTASAATSEWFSITSGESKYRPRLIVEYTVADRPAVTQSDGVPAVQSQKGFLPSALPFSYTTRAFPGAFSYTPAFYKNLVFLMTDDKGKKQLLALDPLGNQVGQMAFDNNETPGQHLLVSQSGRLYIVGNDKIIYIDLDPKNPASLPAKPTKVSAFKGLNPIVPPSLGLNGDLYFVNGLEIYGLNPYLQELWKVKTATVRTSRMTVDPDADFVYLVTQKEGLVTINAQTGEECSTEFKTANDGNAVLYAPVVVRYLGDSEGNGAADKIYVAVNGGNEGLLELFDNFNSSKEKLDCKEKIRAGLNWPPLKGLWSQPIADQLPVGEPGNANADKKIYAVVIAGENENWRGALEEIGWLNNEKKAAVCAAYKPGDNKCDSDFAVGDKSYLANGGNVTLDKSAGRFVWNGRGAIGLYAFGLPKPFPSLLIANQASGIAGESRLYFGTDGTLYTNDARNGTDIVPVPVLRAIIPQYTLNGDSAAKITSPTHLRIDGEVSKATTLQAGGSVLFGPGFTVKKGSRLTVTTGGSGK